MVEVLSAAQMRAAEQREIAGGSASGLELMERAGAGVVKAIFTKWPELTAKPQRAVVLCGPGNNGGDGFVVARLLHHLGWVLDVFLLGKAESLPADARKNYERWEKLGPIKSLNDDVLDDHLQQHPETALAIDALFGTGLTRPFLTFSGIQMALNTWQANAKAGGLPHVVSIDLPSGLCADSGKYLGFGRENPFDSCVMANLTVSFHALKLGHILADGPIGCGETVIADIGLQSETLESGYVKLTSLSDVDLDKAARSHKFSNGSALVLSGGVGKSGAARLAARAALRIGAGVVTLGVPRAAEQEVAAQITGLMMKQIEQPADLANALADKRISALCLGPGLGVERVQGLLHAALTAAPNMCVVLDADALSAFAASPNALFEQLTSACVLTPHMGEFSKLFPDISAMLTAEPNVGPAFSKVDAVRAAAKRAGCTVLLKGADTVIANQSGACRVHSAHGNRAVPWLATAGAGDVLAGLITGLLARGFSPLNAARTAAHLHVDCALAFGPGLIAEDLSDMIPRVLARHLSTP